MFGSLFVVCHLSKPFSAVHSIVIVRAGYIRLLLKLPLKFRNVLQHAEAGVVAPLLVKKISKETSPELEVLICSKTKRNKN